MGIAHPTVGTTATALSHAASRPTPLVFIAKASLRTLLAMPPRTIALFDVATTGVALTGSGHLGRPFPMEDAGMEAASTVFETARGSVAPGRHHPRSRHHREQRRLTPRRHRTHHLCLHLGRHRHHAHRRRGAQLKAPTSRRHKRSRRLSKEAGDPMRGRARPWTLGRGSPLRLAVCRNGGRHSRSRIRPMGPPGGRAGWGGGWVRSR